MGRFATEDERYKAARKFLRRLHAQHRGDLTLDQLEEMSRSRTDERERELLQYTIKCVNMWRQKARKLLSVNCANRDLVGLHVEATQILPLVTLPEKAYVAALVESIRDWKTQMRILFQNRPITQIFGTNTGQKMTMKIPLSQAVKMLKIAEHRFPQIVFDERTKLTEVLDITERFVRTVHDRLLRQDPEADYEEDRVTLKDAEAMLTELNTNCPYFDLPERNILTLAVNDAVIWGKKARAVAESNDPDVIHDAIESVRSIQVEIPELALLENRLASLQWQDQVSDVWEEFGVCPPLIELKDLRKKMPTDPKCDERIPRHINETIAIAETWIADVRTTVLRTPRPPLSVFRELHDRGEVIACTMAEEYAVQKVIATTEAWLRRSQALLADPMLASLRDISTLIAHSANPYMAATVHEVFADPLPADKKEDGDAASVATPTPAVVVTSVKEESELPFSVDGATFVSSTSIPKAEPSLRPVIKTVDVLRVLEALFQQKGKLYAELDAALRLRTPESHAKVLEAQSALESFDFVGFVAREMERASQQLSLPAPTASSIGVASATEAALGRTDGVIRGTPTVKIESSDNEAPPIVVKMEMSPTTDDAPVIRGTPASESTSGVPGVALRLAPDASVPRHPAPTPPKFLQSAKFAAMAFPTQPQPQPIPSSSSDVDMRADSSEAASNASESPVGVSNDVPNVDPSSPTIDSSSAGFPNASSSNSPPTSTSLSALSSAGTSTSGIQPEASSSAPMEIVTPSRDRRSSSPGPTPMSSSPSSAPSSPVPTISKKRKLDEASESSTSSTNGVSSEPAAMSSHDGTWSRDDNPVPTKKQAMMTSTSSRTPSAYPATHSTSSSSSSPPDASSPPDDGVGASASASSIHRPPTSASSSPPSSTPPHQPSPTSSSTSSKTSSNKAPSASSMPSTSRNSTNASASHPQPVVSSTSSSTSSPTSPSSSPASETHPSSQSTSSQSPSSSSHSRTPPSESRHKPHSNSSSSASSTSSRRHHNAGRSSPPSAPPSSLSSLPLQQSSSPPPPVSTPSHDAPPDDTQSVEAASSPKKVLSASPSSLARLPLPKPKPKLKNPPRAPAGVANPPLNGETAHHATSASRSPSPQSRPRALPKPKPRVMPVLKPTAVPNSAASSGGISDMDQSDDAAVGLNGVSER